MSEEETTVESQEAESKETGKGLRAQLEKQIAATKAEQEVSAGYRTQLLDQSYKDLGLDPTKLVGKAIAEKYDGAATTEALAEFAKEEYGYEPEQVEELSQQAQNIALGQAALDQVGQSAGSIVPPTEVDTLAKAEAEGDYATTMAIKGQQMADMLKPRR